MVGVKYAAYVLRRNHHLQFSVHLVQVFPSRISCPYPPKNWTEKSVNSISFPTLNDFLIIILSTKLWKRRKENVTVTLQWTLNSVMVSKLLRCFIWAAILTTVMKKKQALNCFKFHKQTQVFIQIESLLNWEICYHVDCNTRFLYCTL